jgi:hypothetical protein
MFERGVARRAGAAVGGTSHQLRAVFGGHRGDRGGFGGCVVDDQHGVATVERGQAAGKRGGAVVDRDHDGDVGPVFLRWGHGMGKPGVGELAGERAGGRGIDRPVFQGPPRRPPGRGQAHDARRRAAEPQDVGELPCAGVDRDAETGREGHG